jgi:hypothetical protein
MIESKQKRLSREDWKQRFLFILSFKRLKKNWKRKGKTKRVKENRMWSRDIDNRERETDVNGDREHQRERES